MPTAPTIITIPDPVNLDKKIYDCQVGLAAIPWLEKIYGQARTAYSQTTNKIKITYPEVYVGSKNFGSMFPDAERAAYCFFVPRDKATPVDYQPQMPNEWTRPVDFICWYNFLKVDQIRIADYAEDNPDADPLPARDYPFDEWLIGEVREAMGKIPGVTITGLFTEPKNVFAGFSFEEIESQLIRYPYGGFRLTLNIQYLESLISQECPTL